MTIGLDENNPMYHVLLENEDGYKPLTMSHEDWDSWFRSLRSPDRVQDDNYYLYPSVSCLLLDWFDEDEIVSGETRTH